MGWPKGVLASGVVCAVIIMGATFVLAIDYKVTVTNLTPYSCYVQVFWGSVFLDGRLETEEMYDLQPNQTRYVVTGTKCPRGLSGSCGGHAFGRCTLGPDISAPGSCTATCWSSDWFMRKNADGSVRLDKN